MAVLLLLLVFCAILFVFHSKIKSEAALLKSILSFSFLILLSSEILSLFDAISYWPILLFWVLSHSGLFLIIYLNGNPIEKLKSLKTGKIIFSPFQYFVISYLILLYAVTLYIVTFTAPYNWDSMTYHLPRIYQWLQNNSINHFPTTNTRQVILTPFAEFVGLHFYTLSGSIKAFNFVQWFYSLGSLYCVYLIGRELDLNRNQLFFSLLFGATMPMFILQSSSTQNDVVAAFFLLSSVYFVLKMKYGMSLTIAFFLGISTGLAVLSKGTNYIFLLPLAFLAGYYILKIKNFKSALIPSATVLLLFIIINLGYWERNYSVFGSPFAGDFFFVENPDISSTVSNGLKNISQNSFTSGEYFRQPNEFSKEISRHVHYYTIAIHNKLSIELDNVKKTWPGTSWHTTFGTWNSQSEDFVSSPIHTYLIIISLFFIPFLVKRRDLGKTILILSVCVVSFILFSALLKWQMWHNRQLVAIYFLSGIVISYFIIRTKYLGWLFGIVLVLYASNPILDHSKRSFIKGDAKYIFKLDAYEQIFSSRLGEIESHKKIETLIEKFNPQSIGLDLRFDSWEFPLWNYISNKNIRMQHVFVENETAQLDNNWVPDVILSNRHSSENIVFDNSNYRLIDTGFFHFYLKEN